MARRKLQPVNKEHRSALHAVADQFEGFRPASTVLKRVRTVRTRFVQFDHATKVWGLPIERFMLVHGPSNEGKTYFILGLINSVLALDGFAMLVDAERTTPITWVAQIMGDYAKHPGFFAERPDTYEEIVEKIRKWLGIIIRLRKEGKIAEDTPVIIVVDSLRKLVPKGIFDKITKDGKGKGKKDKDAKGVDGVGGRAGQIKAAMNAAWMDELVPLLEKAQAACIAIARESEDPDADAWDRRLGNAFKVGGGKAIYYDSSLVARIERASYVTNGKTEKSEMKIYGERHRITIRKTKVAGRQEKMTAGYFHTSNGVFVPFGFDRARDVVELAAMFDVIKRGGKGSWLSWRGHRWQGEDKAVARLASEPVLLQQLEEETRAKFVDIAPAEFDEDGVVS